MKNFVRAMKFALRYWWRFTMSVVCAALAAVLWSLSFVAIYPVLTLLGTDHNLQTWVNEKIAHIQKAQINPLQSEIGELTKQKHHLDQQPPSKQLTRQITELTGELAAVEGKLQSARDELYNYQRLKRFIDWVFPSGRFQTLAWVLVMVIVIIALKGTFEFWQETLVGSVVNLTLYDLRNRFFRKTVHLDVQNFGEQGTHEMMARFTNDMEVLGNGQKMLLGKVVAEPLKAVSSVILACLISWQLTLLFLVLVPIALYVVLKVSVMMKRATRRLLERTSYIYKILQESLQGIRVVKAFTREPAERSRFRKATKDYYHKAMWVVKLDALSGPIMEILGILAVAAALLAGAYLVMEKKTHLLGLQMTAYPLDAASLLQLYVLLGAIADPVRKLSNVATKISSAAAAADRVFAVMDREPKIRSDIDSVYLPRHAQSVEFQNICFSYEPGHPILSGVDLAVRHGEIIALVGKNGCGKTTLMNLLPRFYDPDHGSILIDGVDIRAAQLRSLRQQLAIVTQDTILFDDTIARNVAYGKRRATREQIEEAARQALAHEFIAKLPAGYDTRIGEAGTKLSGGQKQRIALARAILRDPSILILDEFTSQSDAESEAIVHVALRQFMKDRTTFVITHRLNTLESADRIVVIDGGKIAAVGRHQDLLKSCTLYQRLYEAHTKTVDRRPHPAHKAAAPVRAGADTTGAEALATAESEPKTTAPAGTDVQAAAEREPKTDAVEQRRVA